MFTYRVHRIKDAPAEMFRWEAHTGGVVTVKLKDYEPGQLLQADTPYAAWKLLEGEGHRLRPGDLLEVFLPDEGTLTSLLITKYIGFEGAQWYIPEPKSTALATSYQAGSSEAGTQDSSA